MAEVGTAFVTIIPSARGFAAALNTGVGREVAAAGATGGRRYGTSFAGAAMPGLKTLAGVGATLGVAGLIKSSVQLEAQFSKTMATMKAATGATADEMRDLNKLAMKLGADTSFSASQAADAMLNLAKGGLSPAEIQAGALQGTLTLAAAGSTDLAFAADTAVTALTQFKLGGKDMGRVAAALAGGANASTASVESLAQALNQGGAAAAAAGFTLEETAATMAALDKAGAKGADGGTSLKTALDRLQPTTKAARAEMAKLHLNFTNADGSFKNITEIAGQLHDRLAPLPDAERKLAVSTIFGADAQRFANAMIDQGAAGMTELIKATSDQEAANRMAAAATSGTAGALERMGGAIETAKLGLGRVLAPAIVAAADGIGKVAGKAADAIDKFGPAVQAAAGRFAENISEGLKDIGGKVADVIDLEAMKTKFREGSTAAGGSIIEGLKAAVAAADYAAIGSSVGNGLATALGASAEVAVKLTAALGQLIERVPWGNLAYAIGKQGVTIGLGLVTGLLNFDIAGAFSFIAGHWVQVLIGILTIFFAEAKLLALFDKIPIVGPLLSWLVTSINKVTGPVIRAAGRLVAGIGGAIYNGFARVFPGIAGRLSLYLFLIPRAILGTLRSAGGAVSQLMGRIRGAFFAGVENVASAIFRVVGTIVSALARGLARAASVAANASYRIVVGIGNALLKMYTFPLRIIDRLTGGLLTRLASGLGRAASSAAGRAGEIPSRIGGAISGAVGRVFDAVRAIGSAIVSAASGFGSLLVDAGGQIISGLVSGIRSKAGEAAQAARDAAAGAVNGVKGFLGISSPSKVFMSLGQFAGDGLVLGLRDRTGDVAVAGQKMALAAAARVPASLGPINSLAGVEPGATYLRVQIGERDLTDIVRLEQDRRDLALADSFTYRRM